MRVVTFWLIVGAFITLQCFVDAQNLAPIDVEALRKLDESWPVTVMEAVSRDPIAPKMWKILEPGARLSLSAAEQIAGADKARIVELMHQLLLDSRAMSGPVGYPRVFKGLLQLGDERGMEMMAEKFRNDSSLRESSQLSSQYEEACVQSKQPAIIPHLAPNLFVEESAAVEIYVEPGGDIPSADKISFATADIIRGVLQSAEEIPVEVKAWAKKLSPYSMGREEYRGMMRAWWRENEHYFREKNYQAVRPAGAADTTVEKTMPAKEIVAKPNVTEQPASPVAAIPPQPGGGVDERLYFLFVAATCLLLLGAGLWFTWWRS